MIPARAITAWRAVHPWADDRQVEQDLILTRLAIEIGQHPDLCDRLAWRGGTCLHKLALPKPLRYSEDLDYVAVGVTGADFGTILSALREIAEVVGLTVGRTNTKARKLDIRLRFDPSGGGGPANVKVEVNVDEIPALLSLERRHLALASEWWVGETDLLTFHHAELVGTKFRALAQRSKGRDLNDLELAYTMLRLDDTALSRCAAHYLHHERISSHVFKMRLFDHLSDSDFLSDVGRFVTDPTMAFDPTHLVEKWTWWSDEHLDQALLELDRAAGVASAGGRLADWEQRQAGGILQCARWDLDEGNLRRCSLPVGSDGNCSRADHRQVSTSR
jgi:predicted nucleotidyltransferase component of viral defense system